MSANLLIDLNATGDYAISIASATGVGSTPASGVIIGAITDMINANTFCNVFVAGGATSGPLGIQVQCSDTTTSGSFTDPTSGLLQMPTNFSSGGILWVNSGLWASGNQPLSPAVDNAPIFCSGGVMFGAFQRPQRYARLIALSGTFTANVMAGFISNLKMTGSGGGYSLSPSSGSVSV